jgi:hypothetical protein
MCGGRWGHDSKVAEVADQEHGRVPYLIIAMSVHQVRWVGFHLQAAMHCLNIVVCNVKNV